jgi:hypothetical protein
MQLTERKEGAGVNKINPRKCGHCGWRTKKGCTFPFPCPVKEKL